MYFHSVDVNLKRSDGDGMSTIVLILALLLTSLIAVGLLWWLRFRRPHPITAALPFVKSTHRKLTPEERVSIENYLRNQQNKHGFNTQQAFDSHALAASPHLPQYWCSHRKVITSIPLPAPLPAMVSPAMSQINGAIISIQ